MVAAPLLLQGWSYLPFVRGRRPNGHAWGEVVNSLAPPWAVGPLAGAPPPLRPLAAWLERGWYSPLLAASRIVQQVHSTWTIVPRFNPSGCQRSLVPRPSLSGAGPQSRVGR